jgi:hypothetical protein
MLTRSFRRSLSILLVCLCALPAACLQRTRSCVPPNLLQSGNYIDLNAPPGADRPVDTSDLAPLLARFQEDGQSRTDEKPGKQYRILALSGGGAYGAFSVGVLSGWTCAGNRSPFDVVTGVSTGGLIATFAFLGPEYDAQLRDLYTTVSSEDIYRKRPKIALLWSESAASSAPLKKLIDCRVDANVLQAVAREHASGRRLFIATTNLDARRLVIWDMGAICTSGRPDSLELFRKIVLASASVPGFFPPVAIDVEINGQHFTEMHGDGGATSQVFIRGSMLNLDRDALRAGKRPLVGSDVYVIIAGKYYSDPQCSQRRLTTIGSSALSSLMAAQTRNDLVRIWTLSLLTGMAFHVTAIPEEFTIPSDSLSFDPDEMKRMFDEGYRLGASGTAWRQTPPGTDSNEQTTPRAGTEFVAPTLPQPAASLAGPTSVLRPRRPD